MERCWLDLTKPELEAEMNRSTMISLVERLLPPTQKREWTLLKQESLELTADRKFKALMTYLIKETHAIEYMNSNIRIEAAF